MRWNKTDKVKGARGSFQSVSNLVKSDDVYFIEVKTIWLKSWYPDFHDPETCDIAKRLKSLGMLALAKAPLYEILNEKLNFSSTTATHLLMECGLPTIIVESVKKSLHKRSDLF